MGVSRTRPPLPAKVRAAGARDVEGGDGGGRGGGALQLGDSAVDRVAAVRGAGLPAGRLVEEGCDEDQPHDKLEARPPHAQQQLERRHLRRLRREVDFEEALAALLQQEVDDAKRARREDIARVGRAGQEMEVVLARRPG